VLSDKPFDDDGVTYFKLRRRLLLSDPAILFLERSDHMIPAYTSYS